MSRAVTIGNGNLLVGIDNRGQVRDLYFPYAGHADHISGASGSYVHRMGVWTEGTLRWLSDSSWKISIQCDDTTSSSNICAYNAELGVNLNIVDVVHNEQNIFLRKIILSNDRDTNRQIKLFFGQEFRISESRRGDTAFYDPRVRAIIHYKGHDAFLAYAEINGNQFTDYTVGLFDIEGKKGSYADAVDGVLSKNPIEHGSVDSVLGVTFDAKGKSEAEVHYWLAAGGSIAEVHRTHQHVLEEGAVRLLDSTEQYWHAWTEKEARDLTLFEKKIQGLYRRSLVIMRVHTDNRGGIIASSDTEILNQGRDTYSYVWPRDAAFAANAFDRAGYTDTTQRFFKFMSGLLEEDGYLMHKYRVDGVLGSSWHPWLQGGQFKLPIQEDETAVVLHMLHRHYQNARDLEFIESLYNPFVEPAADFMANYIDVETGLPSGSYDLWEEKYGSSTYTAASVFGALSAAADLSALLGKRDRAKKYRDRATLIKKAILEHLFDIETGAFIKLLRREGEKLVRDTTIDISSFYGIILFGVLDPFDKKVASMFKLVEEHLRVPTAFGGYMRYEGDRYYRTENAPPNAWCLTTLWVAEYYIKIAKNKKELEKALEIITWVADRATESGVLPEQIHPYTGAHLSTSPLVWSHAEFVIATDEYLKKHKALS
jgi:oligosaccharide amylase